MAGLCEGGNEPLGSLKASFGNGKLRTRERQGTQGKREDGNDMIKELKWETLENRRRKTKITSLYRAHLGQKAWVDITARLEKPTYYGRNDHDFKIKLKRDLALAARARRQGQKNALALTSLIDAWNLRGYVAVVINYGREGTTAVLEFSVIQSVSKPEQASQTCVPELVCVRICVSIRRPEFECSGPQLEGPEFECSGPQLEGPEFEYSELSLKVCGSRYSGTSSESLSIPQRRFIRLVCKGPDKRTLRQLRIGMQLRMRKDINYCSR
ncbi:hypothetical protein ANN_02009 [Periplaneta americana]|uniref:Uncharacterized protein n=1 Tax=Periplaneta americana TaxID=6978 RepID=A0ABQ8TV67_PERAM|nr:hypothetical protein ANN_02009 [Periplaneta americana]